MKFIRDYPKRKLFSDESAGNLSIIWKSESNSTLPDYKNVTPPPKHKKGGAVSVFDKKTDDFPLDFWL